MADGKSAKRDSGQRSTWVVFCLMIAAILGGTALICGAMWLTEPRIVRIALVHFGVVDSYVEFESARKDLALDAAERKACIDRPTGDCLWAWALAEARAIEDANERVWMLGQIATKWEKPEVVAEAIATAKAASSLRNRPAETTIVKYLTKVGRLDEALATADSHPEGLMRGSVRSDIASTLARMGRYERALEIAKTIRDPWHRVQALSSIISAQALKGAIAVGVEEAASAVADGSDQDPDTRQMFLDTIADSLARGGYAERARPLARAIADAESRARVFRRIARMSDRPEDRNDAVRAALETSDTDFQREVLVEIGHAVGRTGEAADVREFLASLPEPVRSDEAVRYGVLAGVALAHLRNGQVRRMFAALQKIPHGKHRAAAIAAVLTLPRSRPVADRLMDAAVRQGSATPAVVDALVGLGDRDRAVMAARAIPERLDRARAFIAIARGFKDKRYLETASAIVAERSGSDGADPDGADLSCCIATAYAELGDPRKAFEILRSVSDPTTRRWQIMWLAESLSEETEQNAGDSQAKKPG